MSEPIIGIVGLGLIGGSMARTLKRCSSSPIIGFDKDNGILDKAVRQGVIDEGHINTDFADLCDVIIFATPPSVTLDLINTCTYKKDAVVLDACGIKGYIKNIREDVDFVGMHPMAGKEVSGYDNSDDTLFEGANLLLVKRQGTSDRACSIAEELGELMGFGLIRWTDPDTHDELIAYTSQMPHVLSSIIVSHPLYEECHAFEGGSLNDFTRIARLDAPMWTSLFYENRDNLKDQCDYYINQLKLFKAMLGDKTAMEEYLYNARVNRINHEKRS